MKKGTGLVREPLDVDFTVDPRPLTEAAKNAITNCIQDYKMKRVKKSGNDRNCLF